jgi:Glycosyl hydrolases family 16
MRVLTLATVAALLPLPLTALSAPAAPHRAASSSWGKPVFFDTFNGPLNLRHWSKYNDPWGTRSGVKRTRSSVRVRHGSLELVGHYQSPYGYVSGGVSYNGYQTYGRWVVKFRADAGAGYEPVVLLWPQGTWPTDGEIDLAEITSPQRLGAGEFLHIGADNSFIGRRIPRSVNFTRWHVLAVDWLKSHVTFWLDGRKLWTVRPGEYGRDYIPFTPFHLALQNDAGCATHQCRPNSSTPAQVIMQIAWVKIYRAP